MVCRGGAKLASFSLSPVPGERTGERENGINSGHGEQWHLGTFDLRLEPSGVGDGLPWERPQQLPEPFGEAEPARLVDEPGEAGEPSRRGPARDLPRMDHGYGEPPS